jgi:hypothetical protein
LLVVPREFDQVLSILIRTRAERTDIGLELFADALAAGFVIQKPCAVGKHLLVFVIVGIVSLGCATFVLVR